jgi:hypothetical protein
MPRVARASAGGLCYHVINRGKAIINVPVPFSPPLSPFPRLFPAFPRECPLFPARSKASGPRTQQQANIPDLE